MADIATDDETSLLLQILDDLRIGCLDVNALIVWHLAGEFTRLVERTRWKLVLFDNAVRDSDTVIVLSKRRGLVDDTGTRGVGNVLVGHNSERPVLVLLGKVVKHGHISPSDHVFTLKSADLFEFWLGLGVGLFLWVVSLVDSGQEVFEQDKVLISLKVVDFDVSKVGVDTKTQIGRKGPGSGGPGEQRSGRVVDKGE